MNTPLAVAQARAGEAWFSTILVTARGQVLVVHAVSSATMARDAATLLRRQYERVPEAALIYVLRGDPALGVREAWPEGVTRGLPEGAHVEILARWRLHRTRPRSATRQQWRREAA